MPFLLADGWLRSLLDFEVKGQEDCETEYESVNRLFCHPNTGEFQTVLSYLTHRRYHQALPACERLLKRKPWFLPLYAWAAICSVELDLPYHAWQMVDDGLEQIEKQQISFMSEAPVRPEAVEQRFARERARLCNVLAFAFARARNYRDALGELEGGQAWDSQWWSWMARGRILWLNGADSAARTLLSVGLQESQEAAQQAAYHVEMGKLNESFGRFEEGFAHFIEARNLAPTDYLSRDVFVRALTERGLMEQALVEMSDLSSPLGEGLKDELKKNADRALKLEDRTGALRIEASQSPDPRPYFKLGRVFMRSGQVVQAVQAWSEGLDDAPWDVDCAVAVSRILVEKGGWVRALEILETAIEWKVRLGHPAKDLRLEALRSYVLAQSPKPGPVVVRSLGRCLKMMGQFDRSKKKQNERFEEAVRDFVRAVCVVKYWRYLVPAIRLIGMSKAVVNASHCEAESGSDLYELGAASARGLKSEQFLEVPTFDRLAPLIRYLFSVYQQCLRNGEFSKVRIVGDAVTALVETYPEHEGRIVCEYREASRRDAPRGRPAKKLNAARIEKLLLEGLGLEEIGKRLHVHRNTIYRQAERDDRVRAALDRGRVKYRRVVSAVADKEGISILFPPGSAEYFFEIPIRG